MYELVFSRVGVCSKRQKSRERERDDNLIYVPIFIFATKLNFLQIFSSEKGPNFLILA